MKVIVNLGPGFQVLFCLRVLSKIVLCFWQERLHRLVIDSIDCCTHCLMQNNGKRSKIQDVRFRCLQTPKGKIGETKFQIIILFILDENHNFGILLLVEKNHQITTIDWKI